jgi:hypothetical protein
MKVSEGKFDIVFGATRCKFMTKGLMFLTDPSELMFLRYDDIIHVTVIEKSKKDNYPALTVKSRDNKEGRQYRLDYSICDVTPEQFVSNAMLLLNRWYTYLVETDAESKTMNQRLRDVETALLYAPPPAAGPEYDDAEDRFEHNVQKHK